MIGKLRGFDATKKTSFKVISVYLFISFIMVAFGQPAWVPEAGLLAAAGGYAIFWKAMLQWPRSKFFLAVFWFIAVQAVQLSWMTSTCYMGPWILAVYAALLVGLGVQFGLLSSFLSFKKSLSQFECFALAGAGMLLEWMRLYLFTGFTWNPVGLALAGNRYSIQLASSIGIYGLSFWVFWTNLEALAFLLKSSAKRAAVWACLALFPYGFGLSHDRWVRSHYVPEKHFIAAAINTKMKIEEKNGV